MIPLPALWLPILVSAVVVFLASWVVHSLLPHHKNDFGALPGEDAVIGSMRDAGVKPGDYMFPYFTPQDMGKPEVMAKVAKGPSGVLRVMSPGPVNMGASLAQWFVYLLVVAVFVAYLTSRTVAADEPYLRVFRIAGTAAFLAFSGAHATESIWHKRRWSVTRKFLLDGLAYALLVGGVFGWLWP